MGTDTRLLKREHARWRDERCGERDTGAQRWCVRKWPRPRPYPPWHPMRRATAHLEVSYG